MIAVLGAKGNIGQQIIQALYGYFPDISIRKGTRQLSEAMGRDWMYVDIADENSLYSFINGCNLIINAAGPAREYSKQVARIATQAEIPLIDVGEHDIYNEKLSEKVPVIYGCGAVPGVIGLLPLAFVEGFSSVDSVQVNYIIQEAMTLTAATDMVHNMKIKENGPRDAYRGAISEQIPFLGDSVYRYPYSDQESIFINHRLGATNCEWYMVRSSDDLERLLHYYRGTQQALAEELQRMSRIYSAETQRFIKFLIEIQGKKEGVEKVVTCFAQSSSAALVAGHAVAATAACILEGEVEAETTRMANCSAWLQIWKRIRKQDMFTDLIVVPETIDSMKEIQEGEL